MIENQIAMDSATELAGLSSACALVDEALVRIERQARRNDLVTERLEEPAQKRLAAAHHDEEHNAHHVEETGTAVAQAA